MLHVAQQHPQRRLPAVLRAHAYGPAGRAAAGTGEGRKLPQPVGPPPPPAALQNGSSGAGAAPRSSPWWPRAPALRRVRAVPPPLGWGLAPGRPGGQGKRWGAPGSGAAASPSRGSPQRRAASPAPSSPRRPARSGVSPRSLTAAPPARRSQEFRHAPAVPSWGGGAVHAGPEADCPFAARGAGSRACRHVPPGRRRPGPLAARAPPAAPRPPPASPRAEEADEGAAAPKSRRRSPAALSDVRQGGEQGAAAAAPRHQRARRQG